MSVVNEMTNLDVLWLRTLEDIGERAAHEIKDTLNGVSLSLEVVRSRSGQASSVSDFAATAAAQLELVTSRVDAMLVLSRRPREPADVAMVLRRLAALLVPATKADGGSLTVEGIEDSVLTASSAQATRLALGAALLTLVRSGGGKCCLEPAGSGESRNALGGANGRSAVVRFSHESAATSSLDPEIVSEIEQHGIRVERRNDDIMLVFPAHS